MYSVKFFLREPNSRSETTLNLFVTYQNDRIKLSTGIRIHPELWDTKVQKITSNSRLLGKYSSSNPGFAKKLLTINAKLSDLRAVIHDYSLEIALDKSAFNLRALKDRLRSYLKPSEGKKKITLRVIDYLDTFIDEAEVGERKQVNGSNYSTGTIANYKNLRQTIIRFESFLNVSLEWDMIDRQLYSKFMQWQEGEEFSVNYCGKHAKDLKSLMRLAYEDGVHSNQSFRARWFAVPSKRAEKLPLNAAEMKALHDLNLKPGTTLCKARDLFLIGCYTGLRISDIRKISKEVFVKNESGKVRIHLDNKKTKLAVIIPVSSQLHEVLRRYDYNCPSISNQTANRLIKKLALDAGVPARKASKLSLHLGRHSFVTHLYHSEELPMVDIMQISGHRTERSFMVYVNARPEDSARRMEENDWFQ